MVSHDLSKLTVVYGDKLPQSILEVLKVSDCYLVKLDEHFQFDTYELNGFPHSIIVLDSSNIGFLKHVEYRSAIKISEHEIYQEADLFVPLGFPHKETLRTIQFAIEQIQLQNQSDVLKNTLSIEKHRLKQLTEIGIALSQEKNLGRLLKKILNESQTMSDCDAVSLFLVDKADKEFPQLVFKLAQNTSIPHLAFEEKRFPLSNKSIAGYCALNNRIVNIRNAYQIAGTPYVFDSSFDKTMGYRTISILAVPITNNQQEVIGVLQFINRKLNFDTILSTEQKAKDNVIDFSESIESILVALAGQAGIAIENSLLVDSINNLLNGFVHASVTAIEQRDPTTSGHSFRVADLTVGLAESLKRTNINDYNKIIYSNNELREIRYASLLHDFGKVGVKEYVLVKPKKLRTQRLELIHYRFELEKSNCHRLAQEEIIKILHHGFDAKKIEKIKKQLAEQISTLDDMFETIISANEPSILPDGDFEHLQKIVCMPFSAFEGKNETLITQEDFDALSVRKGSLTNTERDEIQSHVVHSYNFLKQIPWTNELSKVPTFARSHHEKLDGSGYPQGLKSSEIPLASKMMSICDIFDALVAKDRPYKKALPLNIALKIINSEADDGFLDRQLVDIFMHAKVYDITQKPSYSVDWERKELMKSKSICDVNLK
ncbi:MAG: GAF domain-containing protein [Gammaproteobacteria bacterium]|nr:GAF domain-containing protein [Gammaproteobacteria bacterium]